MANSPEPAPRRAAFQRNARLEALLEGLNEALGATAGALAGRYRTPRHPVVLVVGCPRSGSTLLMQWLAHSGHFGYPSNLIARFYAAPYVGACLQQMLADPAYAFRDELADLAPQPPGYDSRLGKTRGALAPNEFWYLWRRHFPPPQDDWTGVEAGGFAAALAGIEAVFDRPLALKGMIANWNLPVIDRLFERLVIVHLHRDPLLNVQSLLEARTAFFGDRAPWYSFPLPARYDLAGLDPVQQVAAQVALTERAIEAGLQRIAPERRLSVAYEGFCADPAAVFGALCQRLRGQGHDTAGWRDPGPAAFAARTALRLSGAEQERARAMFDRCRDWPPAF